MGAARRGKGGSLEVLVGPCLLSLWGVFPLEQTTKNPGELCCSPESYYQDLLVFLSSFCQEEDIVVPPSAAPPQVVPGGYSALGPVMS